MTCLLVAASANAQGTALARGRILADSSELAIAGATVAIPQLRVSTTSDSLGRFMLAGIEPGEHLVIVRRLGLGIGHFMSTEDIERTEATR